MTQNTGYKIDEVKGQRSFYCLGSINRNSCKTVIRCILNTIYYPQKEEQKRI